MPSAERPDPPAARAGGDEPIPMLTEIVEVPRYLAEELPETLAEVDWAELGERVRANVLERLAHRTQALLDAQLRETLQPVIDRTVESVAAELRASLPLLVRDVVARAVNEELTRVHAEIARRRS